LFVGVEMFTAAGLEALINARLKSESDGKKERASAQNAGNERIVVIAAEQKISGRRDEHCR
jgi:hypothetical protein